MTSKKSTAEIQYQAKVLLHGIYKRLRVAGETEQMLRRGLKVHPIETAVSTGRRLLSVHNQISALQVKRASTRFFNVPSRLSSWLRWRRLLFQLSSIRFAERSYSAILNCLLSCLMLSMAFGLYGMYRICRVSINDADARYQAFAIPVLQSLEALEQAEREKKAMQDAMDGDVLRTR